MIGKTLRSRIRLHGHSYSLIAQPSSGDLPLVRPLALFALNAEKVLGAKLPITSRGAVSFYVDGIYVALRLRLRGLAVERVAGADLWKSVLHRSRPGTRIFIVGGREQVLQRTLASINRDFPTVDIVASHHGYFDVSEQSEIIRKIADSQIDIALVALGSPKQEAFIVEAMNGSDALFLGLGGSFDVYVGNKKRAPKSFQRLGFEWLYRFVSEPHRIVRFLGKIVDYFLRSLRK